MAGNTVEMKGAKASASNDEARRERSTISFPYGDLEDAIAVATAIHRNAGMGCSVEQLAAYMKQSATSGAFRLNLSTARIFGLIESEKGQVTLTDIGRRIVDPAQERRARAESFLKVPLYEAIYQRYSKHMLAPPAALEREMQQLGVSSKQTDKARQAFERSAAQANFFEHGRERLVMPAFQAGSAPETLRAEPVKERPRPTFYGGGGGSGGGADSPFIQGLLQKLPAPETEWSVTDRVKWLQTAAHIFGLMYPMPGDDVGDVEVTVKGGREDRGA